MKKIKNGFNQNYYLNEDGTVFYSSTNKLIKPNKQHLFCLKTTDDQIRKISLKNLYKAVYGRPFCIDQICNLDKQEWKVVDDTEGLYYVSNLSRIKSYQGYEAKVLKPYFNKQGYARVDIIKGGKRKSKLVHRLVAAAFLPLPEKIDMNLHHKDFNKKNNAADNLEWLPDTIHAKIHSQKRSKENNGSTKPEKNRSK